MVDRDGDYISRDLYESISDDIDNAESKEELLELREEVTEIKNAQGDDDGGGRSYTKTR